VQSAELCLNLDVASEPGKASLADEVEAVYLQHHDSLCRFLISTGCPVELAPDLLQEAFCRLFETLREGKAVEQPRSWLVKVLYNLLLNYVRKHKREAVFDESTAIGFVNANENAFGNPEGDYARRQRTAQLARAMQQLTKVQLRYLSLRTEGLKFREIAELYGVSSSTVAETCGRALEKLRYLTSQ
jgi:RNA polymerase sigma-70 factor (ECF subfamily)